MGITGEVSENGLGHFLGQLRGADLPLRGGVNQIEMPTDQLAEILLGMVPGVAGE
jgi:hypothetical protein